jgi:transcriptional regulator with XRE-family HTH domain
MTIKNKSKAKKYLEKILGESLTLGALIHSIRKGEEMTQEDFSNLLGISKSHLCDIEKGRKIVSAVRAYNFAIVLGYSEKQFVKLALQHILDDNGISLKVEVA